MDNPVWASKSENNMQDTEDTNENCAVPYTNEVPVGWQAYGDDNRKHLDEPPRYYVENPPLREPVIVVSNDVEQGGLEFNPDTMTKISVANADKAIRLGFLRKVFGLLTMQILITVCIGALFMFTPPIKEYVQNNLWVMLASVIGSIILVIPLFCLRRRSPANFILLIAFTVSEAITVGTLVAFFPKLIVLKALVMTLLILFSLTLYSCQSKYDYSGWYSGLFACLFLLIGGGVMQLFIWSPVTELLIGFAGALVFSIYIIVDTHIIMKHLSPEEYILATITLFLDALNMFIYILRCFAIFGRS